MFACGKHPARCGLHAGFCSKVTDDERPALEKSFEMNANIANTFMVEVYSDRLMQQVGAAGNGAKIKSAQVHPQFLSKFGTEHGRAARLFAERPEDAIIKIGYDLRLSAARHCVRVKK